jgi:glycosyltransferase involved in cell wall biosynthesis
VSSLLHRWRFSDENIVELLNRAAVMVYSARLEPFGLAPLEANACATPVVAVAEGGVRESIRNGVNWSAHSGKAP